MKRSTTTIIALIIAVSAFSQVSTKYERWSYWMTDEETGKKFFATNVEEPMTVTLSKDVGAFSFNIGDKLFKDEIIDVTATGNSIQYLGKQNLYGIELKKKFDVLVLDVNNGDAPIFLIKEIPKNETEDLALFNEIKALYNSMMMVTEE